MKMRGKSVLFRELFENAGISGVSVKRLPRRLQQ